MVELVEVSKTKNLTSPLPRQIKVVDLGEPLSVENKLHSGVCTAKLRVLEGAFL